MNTQRGASFSRIGLEYARRFRDLEFARKTFNEEREKILKSLAEILSTGMKGCGIKSKKADVCKLLSYSWCVQGAYGVVRHGCDASSGDEHCGLQLELWDGGQVRGFGFCTSIFFVIRNGRRYDFMTHEEIAAQKERILDDLKRCGVGATGIWSEGGYLYVDIAFIGPDDQAKFTFESFADEVKALPGVFLKTDAYFADQYGKTWKEK